MLRLVEFELESPHEERISSSAGSVIHGAVMEIVSAEVARILHAEKIRPFSQCVYFDRTRKKNLWRIGTLTAAAYESITVPLLDRQKIFLRQKGYSIFLRESRMLIETSYEQLADEIFPAVEKPRSATLEFLTATSFKRGGGYVIFPEEFLILQSLLQKWNTFSAQIKLSEDDLAAKLSTSCKIHGYKLQTQIFSLEGKNIVGFKGNIRFVFRGNDMVNRILALLMKFAPFSGIGIKTALGMGAVDAEKFF